MPEFTAVDPDSLQDITCTICLEPWDTPLEVGGCGHIFCTKCLGTLTKCPECRGDVTRKQAPNRVLCNMANEAKLRCIVCPWQGTREESRRHTTCLAATAAASPPALVKPQPVAQQPSPPVRTALDTNLSAPAWAATPAPACAPPQRPIQQPPPQQPQRPPQPPANNWHACPWLEFGMTQEEYDHIMCVFMTFDTDGSGELSRRELTTLCRYLNYAQRPEQIDAMFAEMDSDRSGQLSMREFCTWVSMHRPDPSALYGLTQMEYETVQFAFHSADTNQDGFLSESEFVTMLMSQRLTSSAGEAGQVFRTVDMDRDGRVTLDEFLRYRASTSRFGAAPPAPPPQFVPPPAPYVNPAQPYPQAAPIQRPPAQVGRGSVRGTIVEVSGPFNFRFTVVVSIGSNSFGTGLLEAGPCMPVQQNFAVQIPPAATEMVFRVLRNGDGLEVGGTAVNLQHIPLQSATQQYDRWMDLSIVQPAAVNHQPVKLHVKMNVVPN